jgi:mono/diheme cytochrome c family protein
MKTWDLPSGSRAPRRRIMEPEEHPMKFIVGLLGIVAVVVAGAGIFIWSGAYDIAADEPHWPITQYIMETTRKRSIAARASDISVPELEDESLLRAGAGNYDAMCSGCHLRPGLEATEQSRGLFPAPPDLASHRIEDPAAAFWVIKHGIKMSGMPAWGESMDDRYIWGMVAFVRQLPAMSTDRYDRLVEASGGHQHGGTDSAAQEVSPKGEGHSHGATEHSHDEDHSNVPPHQH